MSKYTKEFCLNFCQGFKSKADLVRSNEYVYKVLRKNGWLSECFSERVIQPNRWSEEDLSAEASKYTSRNSFKWGSWNAYHTARRRGLLDEICQHMVTISKSDEDVIYLLENSELVPGKTLHKVGITSKRCSRRRLAELKYASKTTFKVVVWLEVSGAKDLERRLLELGSPVEVPNFRGYKEIRMFNEKELETVVDLLKQAGGV